MAYNADALGELVDTTPFTPPQYRAIQKAVQSKLTGFIKKLDKSLEKHASADSAFAVMPDGGDKLGDGPDAILHVPKSGALRAISKRGRALNPSIHRNALVSSAWDIYEYFRQC